ncbi:hypothetical protein ILUMI_20904 [Ignelater luminosus]|uniref:Uncharacterized protein n=1 Tax=Ignelater luminosus TaxID=2038154 RepID=A0A8K0CHK4_IGNLU|nr:hypothetical protein ILUMI_20904 [Ignelater luminosus]
MKSNIRSAFNYINSMENSRYTIVDDNLKGRQNSWHVRNNSSNVSSLLHPYYDTENELNSTINTNCCRRPIVVSNHCYKEDKVLKFCCDDCYCHKSPVYPKLPLKLIDNKFDKLKGPKCKKFNHFCRCGCGFYSLRSRTDCCNKCCTSPFLRYSARRDAYQNFVDAREFERNFFKEQMPKKNKASPNKKRDGSGDAPTRKSTTKNVEEHSNKIEHVTEKIQNKDTVPYPALNLTENEQVRETCDSATCNKITILDSALNTDRDLRRLNTFRKENYFDCHSSGDCGDTGVCNHQCLHRFVLDDRLIPRPLNTDPYGTSRCVICNKASKSEILKPVDNKIKQKPNLRALKKPKSHRDRIIPNQINICNKNDGIEITVPIYCDKYNSIFNNHIKIKNPPTTNSLALRYQKGVT